MRTVEWVLLKRQECSKSHPVFKKETAHQSWKVDPMIEPQTINLKMLICSQEVCDTRAAENRLILLQYGGRKSSQGLS
jgi:hypothetical protein